MLSRRAFLGAIGLLSVGYRAVVMVSAEQKAKPPKLATVTLTISGMI